MGDEPQASFYKKNGNSDAEEEVLMHISSSIEERQEMIGCDEAVEAMEVDKTEIISSPVLPEPIIDVSMDDEGTPTTRDKVIMKFFKCVAVWSCDSRNGATDIIPLISKFGDIEDLRDQWTRKQLSRWVGVVVIFHDYTNAIAAAEKLPKLIIDGQWPIKAVNIGEWLNKIYAIELRLNETDLKYHVTLVCVYNVNDAKAANELRPSCEVFGPVVDVGPIIVNEQKIPYFIIKYMYSADAYAAKWYMDGKRNGDGKIEVSILRTPKIAAIEREIRRKDMLIWNKL